MSPPVPAPPTAPFDPDVQCVLALTAAQGRKPWPAQTAAEARAASRAGVEATAMPSVAMAQVRNLSATPSDAVPIPMRLYRPHGVADHDAPAVVHFHGGGWLFGDLDLRDAGAWAALGR